MSEEKKRYTLWFRNGSNGVEFTASELRQYIENFRRIAKRDPIMAKRNANLFGIYEGFQEDWKQEETKDGVKVANITVVCQWDGEEFLVNKKYRKLLNEIN